MDLGCRAHDFGKRPLGELAGILGASGFTHIQLAPGKAISDIDTGDGRLSPGLALHIGGVLRAKGLRISVLGSYFNPVHPDPAQRIRGAERFAELLRFGREFGCGIVATETGSLNADFSPHPDNRGEEAFARFVETMEGVAAAAEHSGMIACIEGVARHTIFSPARMRLALDALGSPSVQVLLDPVNFLDESNWERSSEIVEECFELFGDRIMVVHAKDFEPREGGRPEVVPAGTGRLDYPRLFHLLKARKPYIDVILEDIRPEAMRAARSFVTEAWERA